MLDITRLTPKGTPRAFVIESQINERQYLCEYTEPGTAHTIRAYGDTQAQARDTLAALLAASGWAEQEGKGR